MGRALGANVLDIARAAHQIPGVHARSDVVARGFSEGGHAALFAGEMADSYAPELDLVGVVASAPAVELNQLLKTSARTPAALHYAAFAAWGFAATYGLDIGEVMTPAAIESVANRAACSPDPTIPPIGSFTAAEAFVAAPWDVPTWSPRIEENTPGRTRSVPVFVFAGGQDQVVPLPAIEAYVERACATGTPITLFVHPTGGHAGVTSGDLIDSWVDDRRAGVASDGEACDEQPPPRSPPPPGGGRDGDLGSDAAPPASPTTATPTFTG